MKGCWLADQTLSFRDDLPEPEAGEGLAVIKLLLAGICATDLEMVRGYYPFSGVPGHEFVGEVVKAPGNESWVGQRVVGEINLTCGDCTACHAGRGTHCQNRTVLGILGHDGVLAEYFTLPVRNLHRVPDSLPDDKAVFTEPVHIDQVAGGAYDVVVEVTGAPDGFALSRRAVRPGGVLVLKSTFADKVQMNLSALVVDEVTLVGSRCGPFAPALRLLDAGLVDPTPLITARYSLGDCMAAFERAGDPGALKVLVTSDE